MLRLTNPKALIEAPIASSLVCTRITIDLERGTAHCEFHAVDANGVKVGDVHTEMPFKGDACDAICDMAYATAQEQVGPGKMEAMQ